MPSVMTGSGRSVTVKKKYTHPRDRREAEHECGFIAYESVLHGMLWLLTCMGTILLCSELHRGRSWWIVISRGLDQYATQTLGLDTTDNENVNILSSDREIHSGSRRILTRYLASPQVPVKTSPPTSEQAHPLTSPN